MTADIRTKLWWNAWDRAERLADKQVHWLVHNQIEPLREQMWEQVTWSVLRSLRGGLQR